jgi:hypothetical protein
MSYIVCIDDKLSVNSMRYFDTAQEVYEYMVTEITAAKLTGKPVKGWLDADWMVANGYYRVYEVFGNKKATLLQNFYTKYTKDKSPRQVWNALNKKLKEIQKTRPDAYIGNDNQILYYKDTMSSQDYEDRFGPDGWYIKHLQSLPRV